MTSFKEGYLVTSDHRSVDDLLDPMLANLSYFDKLLDPMIVNLSYFDDLFDP